MNVEELGRRAKQAYAGFIGAGTDIKNRAVLSIAKAIEKNAEFIIVENKKDVEAARAAGVREVLIDRLMLTKKRVDALVAACEEIIALPDPVGSTLSGTIRPNGLSVSQVRTPLGVIGVIYESRPNVTVDVAVLCLKAGNVSILRGGKEAFYSNRCLVNIMRGALEGEGLNPDLVLFVEDTARETAAELMRLNGYVDVLIPRGGAGLIDFVVKNATVPVIETGVGNCHVYVDRYADISMAVSITDNAKTSRPSVCNAAETVLVHADVAKEFLPLMKAALDRSNVTLYGCERTREILPGTTAATDEEYYKEFLGYELAVKVVDDIDTAIEHIRRYSSGHSETIVTGSIKSADYFTKRVDSAAVYVNASTRFTDGGEFGMGAEIGISTQKLHVRGPMGLTALTSFKYVIYGDGQIR